MRNDIIAGLTGLSLTIAAICVAYSAGISQSPQSLAAAGVMAVLGFIAGLSSALALVERYSK